MAKLGEARKQWYYLVVRLARGIVLADQALSLNDRETWAPAESMPDERAADDLLHGVEQVRRPHFRIPAVTDIHGRTGFDLQP